jgi:hypothetical protein
VNNSKGEFGIQEEFNSGVEELMIFTAVEYDAGESFSPNNAPSIQHIKVHSRRERGAKPLIFPSNFKIQCN